MLNDWHDWSQINQDTIAFGQGLAVNAVQMAAAVNTVANGGVYVKPSLVKGRATTSGGDVVGSDTTTTHRVISARAARLTAQMMESVTNPETGTAAGAGIEGYRVAGKTGTAQRVGRQVWLLRRHVHGVVRRLRARRQAALHGLRRGPGPEERRRRRIGRRSGVQARS